MTGTMWQGLPQPHTASPDAKSDLDHAMMQVNLNNVLDVRRLILTEAEDLKHFLQVQRVGLRVGNCGSDPVSPLAAQAFNEKIDAHLKEADNYVASLVTDAQRLAQVAQGYGHTEAEIAASFISRFA